MGWKGAEPSKASLSHSVLAAELGWNKTWSLFLSYGKEAEELLFLLSGSSGRKTWQAPKFAQGRAELWAPPAQMDCLRLGRKVPWSEEAEPPLGLASAPAQVEGQCGSQVRLWLEAVECFLAIPPAFWRLLRIP